VLRAAETRDQPAIEAGIHDPEVIRWIGPQAPTAVEALARDDAWRARGSPTLVICEPDGTCVGKVWLERSQADASMGYIGYWLLPVARGRGLATSAVRLMAAWAARELGLERLRITTEPENQRSQRVAERCGFRRASGGPAEAADGRADGQVIYALDGASLR
jgi:RimJ/RimL family protein N-acetyltransferase